MCMYYNCIFVPPNQKEYDYTMVIKERRFFVIKITSDLFSVFLYYLHVSLRSEGSFSVDRKK
jgi:hypothetical protein